jgi:hypothetical protein
MGLGSIALNYPIVSPVQYIRNLRKYKLLKYQIFERNIQFVITGHYVSVWYMSRHIF